MYFRKMAVDKRAGNIFGLQKEDMEKTAMICQNDKEKMDMAMLLFNSKQAVGTSVGYARVIALFKEHCDKNENYNYDDFGEAEIGSFVLEMAKDRASSKAFFAGIKPAISRLETARGIPEQKSGFTLLVDQWLNGAKRRAAELAPEIRKMEPVPKEAIREALEKYIWPHARKPENIDLARFRVIYRWVVMVHTLCRFDGYKELKARHFTLLKDKSAIQVRFLKSKTDQYHNGMIKMLPKKEGSVFCPVAITALYFKRCGYQMDGKDQNYINCRITGKNRGQKAMGETQLSYSTASLQAKQLLKELGYDADRYGESSAKRTGVTEALRQGASIDTIQQVGMWKTSYMPLMYAQNTVEYKTDIVKRMKFY